MRVGASPARGLIFVPPLFPDPTVANSGVWRSCVASAKTPKKLPFLTGNSQKEFFQMFTPLHDRVLVRRIEGDDKTSGGLIIPDNAKEKPQEGEVVSVGTGARDDDGERIAMDVKAGDKILFGKWSGTEIKLDGEDLIIMKESDVLGILA
jgi:chaperonin GroES